MKRPQNVRGGNVATQSQPDRKRILGRILARELTEAELNAIGGAGYSCCNHGIDDCFMN